MPNMGRPLRSDMTPSKTKLGSFIRDTRIKLGLSQYQLAELAGMSQNYVSSLEIGRNQHFREKYLEGLTKALQCEKQQLLDLTPDKFIPQPRTELGRFIRSQREKLNMSIEDFAKKMNMAVEQARGMELSRRTGIQYKMAKRLALTLEIKLQDFSLFLGKTQKPTQSKLGRLIRKRRKMLGLSCRALADKLGISAEGVSQIEREERRSFSKDVLEKLAHILNISISELTDAKSDIQRKVRKTQQRDTALGTFLTERRRELRFTQVQVAELIGTKYTVISNIERGARQPDSQTLGKIATVLDCEIPANLIPTEYIPEDGKKHSVTVYLSDQELNDFVVTKNLLDTKTGGKVVRKALNVFQQLLEEEYEGYAFVVRKDGSINKIDLRLA